MRLRPLLTSAVLGLIGLAACGQSERSNLAVYGAPRHNLDPVPPDEQHVRTKANPTCGKGSGTASRRVAYYEGW